jgi:hypothetical protein
MMSLRLDVYIWNVTKKKSIIRKIKMLSILEIIDEFGILEDGKRASINL